MLQFQMSPSPLSASPLFPLSGTLTVSFTLIKTNNKLIHLIRIIQKLNISHPLPQALRMEQNQLFPPCHRFFLSLLEQG